MSITITDLSISAVQAPRIDLQVTLPQSTLSVTRIGAGRRSEPVAIQAGLDVMLYCPSSATNTRWFKRRSTTLQPVLPSTNHISLTTTDIQGVSTVVLSIQGLRDEDYGEYVCVATNEAGRDEASVTINSNTGVYIDPSVIFTPGSSKQVNVIKLFVFFRYTS